LSVLVRPYEPLPPKGAVVLADRLEQSISLLPSFGIKVNPSSRLPHAVRVLRAVYSAGAYPVNQPELIRVGNAIKAAFNFVQVVDAIKPPGPPGVLNSLRRAVDGTLDDIGSTPAHRAQSELFFGAVLVAGGASAGAPAPSKGKTPDYVAEVDTLPFSVEVKRPESVLSVEDAVAKAVKQARKYKAYPAQVALDLSDLLPATYGVADVRLGGAQNQAAFRAAYGVASSHVTRHLKDPNYARVAGLFCFAESFLWTVPNPQTLPFSTVLVYGEVFHSASAGLIVDQSRRLRERIVQGFTEVGGVPRWSRRVP